MLRQSLTYKLATISQDAISPSARLFKSRFGIDVHHLRILRLIDDSPGMTFTSLAAETKFERSATSRSLSRLITAGLVLRRNDKDDARRFELFATVKGKVLRERADPVSLEMERLMLEALGPGEKKAFLAALDKLEAWVHGGYSEAVVRKFPDAGSAKPKPSVAPVRGPANSARKAVVA